MGRSRYIKAGGVVAGLFLLSGAVGCQPPANKIAEIPPYAGDRPAPIQRLRDPYRPQQMQPYYPPQTRPVIAQPTPRPHDAPMTGVEPGWMPRGGISDRWRYIVVHHSADDRSTPQGMADWHVKGRGWDALGYHFVIGNGVGYGDGQVYIGERWPKQMHGAHCKTPSNDYNDHGIGICLIGDLDRHPPSAKQVRSLARLLAFLSNQAGIPKSHILTHGGVTHKTKCPGKYFSLQNVIKQMPTPTVTAGPK